MSAASRQVNDVRRRSPRRKSCCAWLRGVVLGRRYAQDEGQALPLAAIGILAMELIVLATINLGDVVHEKIKLQNTADSAAYSLAAMEARTFNYIAFLNRTQIAHYNTAMVVQSYMSWVGFNVTMFNVAMELVLDLNTALQDAAEATCGHKGLRCEGGAHVPFTSTTPMCSWFVGLWRASCVVGLAAQKTATVLARMYGLAGRFGHQIVEAMQIFNKDVIWQAQFIRAFLVNLNLLSGAHALVELNDPDMKIEDRNPTYMLITSLLNSFEYYKAFDQTAGINPSLFGLLAGAGRIFSGKMFSVKEAEELGGKLKNATRGSGEAEKLGEQLEAYIVMTELSNASRFPTFVSDRSGDIKLSDWIKITGTKRGQTKFIQPTSELLNPSKIDSSRIQAIDPKVSEAESAMWETPADQIEEKDGKQTLKAFVGSSNNQTVGVALASHDYFAGGKTRIEMMSTMLSRLGTDKLGDAIFAHHSHGWHRTWKGSENDKPLNEGKGFLESLRGVGKDMMGNMLGTFKSLTSELSDFGRSLGSINRSGGGTASSYGRDQDMEDLTQSEAGHMSSMTGGMANSFSEWAGGLADSQGKLGEIFSSKVDALIGDVTERINQIGNNLSNQVMDRIEMGLLHQSGKISAVTSSFKTISKYLNGGKYTDNMSMHTKGVIWPGFAPYFKFKPSSDRTTDFNQPSTWIFLNKSHDQFQGKTKDYGKGKTPWVGKFGWQHGELEAALDTSMAGARQMVFFEGLNAWSRGMAYYHRPGNWNEQPNFFNPYWRARLAPIGQKLQAFWERFVGQQLSGDDIVVSQLLSAIRNAQMELVTAFVSSLVTH